MLFEGRGKPCSFGNPTPTIRSSLGSTGTKIHTRVTWERVAFGVCKICVVAVWDTGTKIRTRVTWGRVRFFFGGGREFLCRSGDVLFEGRASCVTLGVCHQQIATLLVARVLKFVPV